MKLILPDHSSLLNLYDYVKEKTDAFEDFSTEDKISDKAKEELEHIFIPDLEYLRNKCNKERE